MSFLTSLIQALLSSLAGGANAGLIAAAAPELWIGPAAGAADFCAYLDPNAVKPAAVRQVYEANLLPAGYDDTLRGFCGPNTNDKLPPIPAPFAVEMAAIGDPNPATVPIVRDRARASIATLIAKQGVGPSFVAIDMSQIIDGDIDGKWASSLVIAAVRDFVSTLRPLVGDGIGLILPWPADSDAQERPAARTTMLDLVAAVNPPFVHVLPDHWVARRDDTRWTPVLAGFLADVRARAPHATLGLVNWCHGKADGADPAQDLKDQFNWYRRALGSSWPDRLIIESWGTLVDRGEPAAAVLVAHAKWARAQFRDG